MTRKVDPMSSRAVGIAGTPWRGKVREYDLFKELTVGVSVMVVLTVVLSLILGSPDEPSVTLKSWANAQTADFAATATAELGGTSDTAQYGPPYTNTKGATQTLGALDLQSLSGVQLPVNTANAFVLDPLATLPSRPTEIATWRSASSSEQAKWTDAYATALGKAPKSDPLQVASGNYGPVPALIGDLTSMAKSGALDGAIQAQGNAYNLNYTNEILFLGDGQYFQNLAADQHLTGDQWGMMNETGSTPGQSWLWLFSFFYQIPPFSTAANADLLVVGVMLILTLLLALVPFIPWLRRIPKWIPVHRLVWKDYYRKR